jgi:hypothetical protein
VPVADYFDLLPLLLPRERRSLLILGWHPALASRLGRWEKIRVQVGESVRAAVDIPCPLESAGGDVEFVESAEINEETTLLACGVGPQGWKGALPALDDSGCESFLALAPSDMAATWRRQLPRETWALAGLPVLGRPWVWVPQDGSDIDWNVFSPRGRIELPWIRFNRWLGRTALRARGISLLAGGPSTPLRQILSVAAPGSSDAGRFWNHTKKNTLVLLTRTDPALIVKVPLDPEGRASMLAHQHSAESFRASKPQAALLDLLPRKTRLLSAGEFEAGIEEAFSGVSAYRYLPRKRALREIQGQAARLLLDWQTAGAQPQEQGRDEFERYWEAPLRPLARVLEGDEACSVYSACLERLEQRVVGRVFPIVPTHGDFWINNLMWDSRRGEISGILDWDRGQAQGLPLLDLFQLLFQRTHYLYSLHSRWSLRRTLGAGFPGREGRMIRAHAARFELSEEQIEDLFCRYWLGEAASNADTFLSEPEHRRALQQLGRWIDR